MITEIKSVKPTMDDEAEVGNLNYGTLIKGVTGHPNTVYMKINKRYPGEGITVQWPRNESVLANIKTGTLRSISGDSVVKSLEGSLRVSPAVALKYVKFGSK